MRARESDLEFEKFTTSSPKWIAKWHVKHDGKLVAYLEEQTEGFRIDLVNSTKEIEKCVFDKNRETVIDSILDWIRVVQWDIIHVSDNHSTFPNLPKGGELVVCSGDFLPNATRGDREIEEPYQIDWLKKRLLTVKEWVGDRKFLFCSGNHDFIDPCELMQSVGIDTVNITNAHYEHKGVKFYGFPYIPWICGEWNNECRAPEMSIKINELKYALTSGVDVLVTHSPPHGVLDANATQRIGRTVLPAPWAEFCGNTFLTNLLSYGVESIPKNIRPKYLLCGHIHESNGWADVFGLTISQAATTVHTVEIKL